MNRVTIHFSGGSSISFDLPCDSGDDLCAGLRNGFKNVKVIDHNTSKVYYINVERVDFYTSEVV